MKPKLNNQSVNKLSNSQKEKLYQLIGEIINLFNSDYKISDVVEFEKDSSPKESLRITNPDDILPFIWFIAAKKQEHFLCLTLNGANEVIENRIITIGLLKTAPIHPREVFTDAVADRAAAIITAHNHPSGTLEPSKEDLIGIRNLADAGEILGIPMLDHIIITQKGYVSFKKSGLI